MQSESLITVLPGVLGLLLNVGGPATGADLPDKANMPAKPAVSDEMVAKIAAALPEKAQAQPLQPRKLLVFTLAKGFKHGSIPVGAKAIEMMGEKTGAYTATVSDDVTMFQADKLKQFDAVCMVSTTGTLFTDAELKKSLLDFVSGGKGYIGIHAASDSFYDWPEYGTMVGGYFNHHPWHANEKVGVRVEDPTSPLCAPFKEPGFDIVDEIYQFKAPYSRDKLRVLLSLDPARTDMTKKDIERTDNDFAVSWVKNYGQGRVFYCSLGHNDEIYWDTPVLGHYLAGIQFALGDLKADTTSHPRPADPAPVTATGGKPASAGG